MRLRSAPAGRSRPGCPGAPSRRRLPPSPGAAGGGLPDADRSCRHPSSSDVAFAVEVGGGCSQLSRGGKPPASRAQRLPRRGRSSPAAQSPRCGSGAGGTPACSRAEESVPCSAPGGARPGDPVPPPLSPGCHLPAPLPAGPVPSVPHSDASPHRLLALVLLRPSPAGRARVTQPPPHSSQLQRPLQAARRVRHALLLWGGTVAMAKPPSPPQPISHQLQRLPQPAESLLIFFPPTV